MDRAAVEPSTAKRRGIRQRRSLFPNTVVLMLAIAALLTFIGIMGDARRTRNAILQADTYAAGYASRAAQTKVLPLNLEPGALSSAQPKLIDFEWLPTEHVRALRAASEPVLAAWSVPVRKFFGRDGRAAIVFHKGNFTVKWMDLAEFDQSQTAQAELVGRLSAAP